MPSMALLTAFNNRPDNYIDNPQPWLPAHDIGDSLRYTVQGSPAISRTSFVSADRRVRHAASGPPAHRQVILCHACKRTVVVNLDTSLSDAGKNTHNHVPASVPDLRVYLIPAPRTCTDQRRAAFVTSTDAVRCDCLDFFGRYLATERRNVALRTAEFASTANMTRQTKMLGSSGTSISYHDAVQN